MQTIIKLKVTKIQEYTTKSTLVCHLMELRRGIVSQNDLNKVDIVNTQILNHILKGSKVKVLNYSLWEIERALEDLVNVLNEKGGHYHLNEAELYPNFKMSGPPSSFKGSQYRAAYIDGVLATLKGISNSMGEDRIWEFLIQEVR